MHHSTYREINAYLGQAAPATQESRPRPARDDGHVLACGVLVALRCKAVRGNPATNSAA